MRTVGLVTVTYNSAGVLEDFLRSARSQRHVHARVYAVDSGSSDGTLPMLRSQVADDLVVIENADNVGFAEGSNQGIVRALADGVDYVMLINNDTIFGPDLVATLVGSLERHELDVVSPLILAEHPENAIWYAGGSLSRLAMVARHIAEGEDRASAPSQLTQTEFGSACCLLIRPHVFERAGMFDPIYFVYFDDVDLAVRIRAAGFQYWVEPAAVLTHKASALTGGKRSLFTLTWTARNWPLMVRRHRRGLPLALALGFVQLWIVGRFLLRRDPADVLLLRERQFAAAMRVDLSTDRAPTALADEDRGGLDMTSSIRTSSVRALTRTIPPAPVVIGVVPLFNPDPSVAAGIRALHEQVDHVLLVDDGSRSSPDDLVEGLHLTNITLLRSTENNGIARALNLGVRAALDDYAADFVLTMDQDSSSRRIT